MAARDPEVRKLVAQMGGYAKSARCSDRAELTRAATLAASARWDAMVPPEVTDPAVRQKMADAHMRQHMAAMVLARKRAARLRAEADQLEAEAGGESVAL